MRWNLTDRCAEAGAAIIDYCVVTIALRFAPTQNIIVFCSAAELPTLKRRQRRLRKIAGRDRLIRPILVHCTTADSLLAILQNCYPLISILIMTRHLEVGDPSDANLLAWCAERNIPLLINPSLAEA